MNNSVSTLILVGLFSAYVGCARQYSETIDAVSQTTEAASLVHWAPGVLDIHHINTGRGNAAFFVFPDGTTMLFDAGDLDAAEFLNRAAPLILVPQRPSADVSAGAAIAAYIRNVSPNPQPVIDYAVISHFHGDHYGVVREGLTRSSLGDFVLTGITEVAEQIPIATLLDRGYPAYDSPTDLAKYHGATFRNYLEFQRAHPGMHIAQIDAGSMSQISLNYNRKSYPDFVVRNVKSGEQLWSGVDDESEPLFDPTILLNSVGRFTENPLSIALTVSYGEFDYFTGGDLTGLAGPGIPDYFDVESDVAAVVGEVDVLTLNHHGNRDATNANFLATLQPRVIVQQSWVSDHPGGEVVHRMLSEDIYPGPRDIFATHILRETQAAIGPWLTNNYKSLSGHILIRVSPGGHRYDVYILDDQSTSLSVIGHFGPYEAR